jgi:hypothetical protein
VNSITLMPYGGRLAAYASFALHSNETVALPLAAKPQRSGHGGGDSE